MFSPTFSGAIRVPLRSSNLHKWILLSIRKDNKIILVIQSFSFYTSKGKYGPFGEETGRYFSSGITEGMVVGFHGRSSMYLDAIGVHMQHWLGH